MKNNGFESRRWKILANTDSLFDMFFLYETSKSFLEKNMKKIVFEK